MMRTDTTTFRKRMTRDLQAAGLKLKAARACATAISNAAWRQGSTEIKNAARACVSFDSDEFQSVYVEIDGQQVFHAWPSAEYQPLVVTEATDEQRALGAKLEELLFEIYGEKDDPKTIAAIAAYDEIQAQILAINPNVHAAISDPDRYESYHNIYKSVNGIRPRGFVTLESMRREIASLALAQATRVAA